MNEKWKLSLPVETDCKLLSFCFSYCYQSVILVIHTHKSTLALINKICSQKLLIQKQKWFCKFEREMKTESSCLNGIHITLFLFELLLQSLFLSYTHKRILALIWIFRFPKVIKPRQKWFYKVSWKMKTESSCINRLRIHLFLVELLLRERNLVIHTHKSKRTLALLQNFRSQKLF